MPWLITATLGDAPTGILACAGLLIGVFVMARGRRGRADGAPRPEIAAAQTAIVVPAPAEPDPEPPSPPPSRAD